MNGRDVPPWHPEASRADRDAAWHAQLDAWRDELDPPHPAVWDLPSGKWLWLLTLASLAGWAATVWVLWYLLGGWR